MEEREAVGFWPRLAANILDGLILGVPLMILSVILYGGLDPVKVENDPTYTWGGNITDVISFLYALLLPVFWKGYVIGKRILGIRIVQKTGENVTIITMLLRNVVGGLVYGLPVLIGIVVGAGMIGGSLFSMNPSVMLEEDLALKFFFAVVIGAAGSLMLLLTSAIMVGVREDKRSIHDLIAGTYVTYKTPHDEVEIKSE
ncbi:RDD family protein [Pontibacillus sp. ALD_SL1]|uniref:RDD family protein n=1 Tax=Pontibacillus sp. ALD_SL1 TaxID=2777185 RepID=UPI001F60B502|nr:RDD family protein [Pontibacillus sp. ALD_SL1]